jgi:predicted ATPase
MSAPGLKATRVSVRAERLRGADFRFKHALTQDVAYDSLLSPVRRTLHEATARALETI